MASLWFWRKLLPGFVARRLLPAEPVGNVPDAAGAGVPPIPDADGLGQGRAIPQGQPVRVSSTSPPS